MRHIIKIKTPYGVDSNETLRLYTEKLEECLLNTKMYTGFEVFTTPMERARILDIGPITRKLTIDPTNTIDDSSFDRWDLNPDINEFYVQVFIPDDVDFDPNGIFVPRAFGTYDKKCGLLVDKIIALDYVKCYKEV